MPRTAAKAATEINALHGKTIFLRNRVMWNRGNRNGRWRYVASEDTWSFTWQAWTKKLLLLSGHPLQCSKPISELCKHGNYPSGADHLCWWQTAGRISASLAKSGNAKYQRHLPSVEVSPMWRSPALSSSDKRVFALLILSAPKILAALKEMPPIDNSKPNCIPPGRFHRLLTA